MTAVENNLQNDFIEPEEDFLAETDFPAADDDVLRKKPALGRRPARRKKIRDFSIGAEAETEGFSGPAAPAPAMVETETPLEVKSVKFPELEKSLTGGGILTSEMFDYIPVQVKVILGTTEVTLKEVMEMSENSIITLDKLIGESLDLVINEQVIAQGEVVVVDGNYGLKITKIIRKK